MAMPTMYAVRVSCTMLAEAPNHGAISGMDARYMSVAMGLTAERTPNAPTNTAQSSRGLSPSLLRTRSGGSWCWDMRHLLGAGRRGIVVGSPHRSRGGRRRRGPGWVGDAARAPRVG
ncbi:hypothetical protein KVA01_24360 [Kocuria varians]|uniref:Uncharacterized protein n=1 Tax=Kocuria varians TaxID=1272 RepID=A0A4Y4D506_KOCVA|nr:hypothetical protein KVA01_24360 [Kocuria varians]